MKPVWVTKYALSSGIQKIIPIRRTDEHCRYRLTGCDTQFVYRRKSGLHEFATSEKEALEIAEKMRVCKLESLAKQIKKLRVKRIEIKDQIDDSQETRRVDSKLAR